MLNSVIRYLENTTLRFPSKTAIIDKDKALTFSELRNRALLVGAEIIKHGNPIKKPIFVYLPKGCDIICAFMGVLYSGNFYTPTDVRFPFEKVKGILDALNPELIISDEDHSPFLIEHGVSKNLILTIESCSSHSDAISSVSLLNEDIKDSLKASLDKTIDTDIAYILFTSGSMGVPKGVAITHGSIIDYIDWAKECFKITEQNIIANQAPFYFDNSTLDIYLMLSTGSTLHIIPEQYYSFPAKLMSYVAENKINTVFWVPSVLINVANADILSAIDTSCLQKILFAGEVMPNKHLNYWRRHLPNALYANLYGPTEITVDCTYYIVDREFKDDEPLPIGSPCPNTEVLLLDEQKQLITEHNKIGELCVRGRSLAVGYWKNPDKTQEAFIQNPLNDNYSERIYCTGDLAHYNELGEIMYDGRKDFQIKHMGYRIELGEIETAAVSIEAVKEVCCLYDLKEKRIVLFYVGDVVDKELRSELARKIPKYMIPTVYHQLNNFPYNDNGKIDRKKLQGTYLGI